jgi:hypothetical protein
MVEPGNDHTDSKHSIDDLFQLLVRVRDIPPAKAKKQILESFQLNQLQVNYHIRGGARTTQPNEKFRAHPYEVVPPEGITALVHFESWDGLFRLAIRDGHLVVESNYSLDYPWDAYSFTIANWWMVDELWPLKPPAPTSPAALFTREVTLTVADWPATYGVTSAPTVAESSVDPQADINVAPAVSSLSAEETSESLEKPIPRLQEMRRAGILRGVRQRMVAKWACDAYPPDGNIPEGLTASEMLDAIQHWRKHKDMPRLVDEALLRVCRRVLKAYRK